MKAPRDAAVVAFLTLVGGVYIASCQAPDEYFRDAGLSSTGGTGNTVGNGGRGGTGNTSGNAGTGGGPIGAGGSAGGTTGGSAAGTTGGSATGRGGSNGGSTAGTTGGSAAGRGGSAGGTTGGSTAGRGGTTGGSAGGSTGGSTGRGGSGAGGTTGANCVETIILNGYASPPAPACSACTENGMSREVPCKAMLDCLEASFPCTGNCYSQCRNSAMVSGPTESCVTAILTAADCP